MFGGHPWGACFSPLLYILREREERLIWGRKEVGRGARRCGGKGNYSQNVMYERSLKVNKIERGLFDEGW